jgi:hypothetical protein
MLNPSTADETTNDSTIERCERRARRWGYGGLTATNLFAWCSTKPTELKSALHPIGGRNDLVIARAARDAAIVVCAWGVHGSYLGRSTVVLKTLHGIGVQPHVLALTRAGEPAHPLYLGYGLVPALLAVAREADCCLATAEKCTGIGS